MSSASAAPPPLPAERPLTIVLYRDKWGRTPLRVSRTWSEFADFITNYVESSPCTVADGPSKCVGKECPHKSHSSHPNNPMAWSPVEIEGLRRDKNVRSLTLLSLDFDHVTEEQAFQVGAALAGRAYVLHTTHNHRVGDFCFRVVLPLSRPVSANVWHQFLPAAIDLLSVTVQAVDKKGKVILQPDRVCKNRDRLYFRPSHPKDGPHSALVRAGRVLDVDEVMARAATMPQPEDERRASRELPEEVSWDLESEPVQEVIDLIAQHMPDRQRHELALALGGMLRAHGATKEDAHYILHEGFLAGGSQNPAERAKTVEHTYDLASESAMTGFTRVSEIIGASEARDIGYCFAAAAEAEFLERISDIPDEPPPLPGTEFDARPTTYVGDAPALTIDLGELSGEISKLATRLATSAERDEALFSVVVRRALAGKAPGNIGGVADVETVRDNKTTGIDLEEAVDELFRRIGWHLDQGVTWSKPNEDALWQGVRQVLRSSIAAAPLVVGKDWEKIARLSFGGARRNKFRARQEEAAAVAQRAEAARTQALATLPPPLPQPVTQTEMLPALPPDGSDWEAFVTKTATGVPESTLDNARLYLENHPDFCGHLRFNVVTKKVEATGGIPAALGADGFDSLKLRLADYLTRTYRITVDETKLAKRIVDVALKRKYDPIEQYLKSLVWDGKPRLDVWLQMYCGAEKTETNAEFLKLAGRRWLISLVARGIKVSTSRSPSGPGAKVDNVLVLQGDGGIGKSAIFRAIGGEWFCDTVIALGDKDSRMMAAMYWLCEMPELVTFKRSSHESLKAFFSQEKDAFRLPYGSSIDESPRRCLFVGTTNDDHILGDPTGNRKYLCVTCFVSDELVAALVRDRDQLLAEAVAALRSGEKWWFSRDEITNITEPENEGRVIETVARSKIAQWWFAMDKKDRPLSLTTLEVAEQALELEIAHIKDSHLQQVGYALKEMKFKKRRDTTGAFRPWRYYATDSLLNAEKVSSQRRGLFVLQGGKKTDDEK